MVERPRQPPARCGPQEVGAPDGAHGGVDGEHHFRAGQAIPGAIASRRMLAVIDSLPPWPCTLKPSPARFGPNHRRDFGRLWSTFPSLPLARGWPACLPRTALAEVAAAAGKRTLPRCNLAQGACRARAD